MKPLNPTIIIVAIIAAVAVIAAAWISPTTLNAIIGAVIAAGAGITVAWISHSTKISDFRQAWINALRDDLATYFKELEALHFIVSEQFHVSDPDKCQELERRKQDTRNALQFAYRRIVMRLNMNEQLHIDLESKLSEFFLIKERVADQKKIDHVMSISRQLLKKEWDVTKEFPLFRWFSQCCKNFGASHVP